MYVNHYITLKTRLNKNKIIKIKIKLIRDFLAIISQLQIDATRTVTSPHSNAELGIKLSVAK